MTIRSLSHAAGHRSLAALTVYGLALGACLLTAAITAALHPHLDLTNTALVFLLVVFLVARTLGRGPAVLAAFLAVGLFDFVFVPPQLTLAVANAQYAITLGVMLCVALITGGLTAGLRREAELAQRREGEARQLYEAAKDLAGALTDSQVAEVAQAYLATSLDARGCLLLNGPQEALEVCVPGHPEPQPLKVEQHLALMAQAESRTVEYGALAADGCAVAYFPLLAPTRPRGVLAVAPRDGDGERLHALHPQLEALASLLAIALERIHYAAAALKAEREREAEQMRNSLLSAISHDLRTPLTALRAMAESLVWQTPPGEQAQREAATAVRDQALRLSGMVDNLLDMARLQSGRVTLHREWQPLEEVVGAALQLIRPALGDRPVQVQLAPDLPLLHLDAVLMERVFANLVENAAKYAPAATPIRILAERAAPRDNETWVEVAVRDQGPGFPPGLDPFQRFTQGAGDGVRSGVGLGLAICQAVIAAHGGHIRAGNGPEGGGEVRFSLPVGQPPALDGLEEDGPETPAPSTGERP